MLQDRYVKFIEHAPCTEIFTDSIDVPYHKSIHLVIFKQLSVIQTYLELLLIAGLA